MDNKIAEAIAAARQVAAQVQVPAAHTETAVAAVAPLPAGKARTLDEVSETTGTGVDAWLSVDSTGYRLGNTPLTQIVGKINLAEVLVPYMIRFTAAGSVKFVRSYDGIRESQSGRPWADVCAQAQRADPNCKGQYNAAEIPVILDSDLIADGVTHKAGSRLGITTPVTGFKPFLSWYRETKQAFGADGVVPVVASVEVKTKAGVRPWGIPVFTVRS